MSTLARLPLALVIAAIGMWLWFELDDPHRHPAGGIGILLGFLLIAAPARKSVLRFGSLAWNENELCRHILITGDTGCGKTSSGFHSILVQLTKTIPNWGGLVLGVKGDEHAFLAELMGANGRSEHVIHIEVRPHDASPNWSPPHRYNLLSDRSLPWTTHGKAIVDVAASLTDGRQDSFFKPMAQIALANALQLLSEIGEPVTITRAYHVLTVRSRMEQALDKLEGMEPAESHIALMEFFHNTFIDAKATEQREGIEGTIKT
jgi:hypothetical protein